MSIFGISGEALLVRKERMAVLANNIANADTPNFKARDIDWRRAIAAAHEGSKSGEFNINLKKTNAMHITGSANLNTSQFLKYRIPTQPSLDGNTVETHIEKAKFMENAMQYQFSLERINSRISGIRSTLRGQ